MRNWLKLDNKVNQVVFTDFSSGGWYAPNLFNQALARFCRLPSIQLFLYLFTENQSSNQLEVAHGGRFFSNASAHIVSIGNVCVGPSPLSMMVQQRFTELGLLYCSCSTLEEAIHRASFYSQRCEAFY